MPVAVPDDVRDACQEKVIRLLDTAVREGVDMNDSGHRGFIGLLLADAVLELVTSAPVADLTQDEATIRARQLATLAGHPHHYEDCAVPAMRLLRAEDRITAALAVLDNAQPYDFRGALRRALTGEAPEHDPPPCRCPACVRASASPSHVRVKYEPCVIDATGRCTRWSHDHDGDASPTGDQR